MKSLAYVTATFLMMALMAGCGGGGSGGTGATALSVTGVAAAGAPLIGTVTLKDSSSTSRQLSTSTAANGSFSFDVSGLTAPFLLQATGTAAGHSYTLYSMVSSAGNCSINPLTHLAVTMANAGQDPSGVFMSPTPARMQTLSGSLQAAVMTVQSKLAPLITQVGAASANIITDQYSANSQGLDLLFDLATFTIGNGSLSITSASNGAVILASTPIMNGVINGSLNGGMLSVHTVSGTVASATGAGLSGVAVTASVAGAGMMSPEVKTDSNGNYTLFLPAGSYTLRALLNGYTFSPSSIAVSVSTANITGKNFTAASVSSGYTVSGAVKTASGTGIPGATVSLAGSGTRTATSDSSGNYSFSGIANGSYTLSASMSGYTFSSLPISVNNANASGQNISGTQVEACSTMSISPASNNFPPGIGVGTVTVTASSSCQWAPPVSNAAWLTATSISSGSGGTVNYALSANTSNSARTGQIFIGSKIFTVQQAAQTCSYSIFPSASFSVSSSGGSGSVSVAASSSATGSSASNCPWTAVSNNPDWIIINGANSGSGAGTVSYTVLPHTGNSQRTGTMTIAGQTYTVTQATAGVTGSWYGTLSMPGASYPGCSAQTTSFSLSLNESAGMNITGSTSNSRTITSGSRSGTAITVTLSTNWGARGPYVWTWNGTNTITGAMAYFCYNTDTGAIISEGTETFSVTRN